VTWYLVFLALLALQRLGEMALTRRHSRWARARGATESGARQLVAMKLLHTCFLIGCAAEVVLLGRAFVPWVGFPMLALALAAQALRYWTMRALGPFWNVRVFAIPGVPVVTDGPYRWVRHPNYAAVVVEGIAVPMVHGAWLTAALFSLANAALLAQRIGCEERALRACPGYAEKLAHLPRFLPARWLPLPVADGGAEVRHAG